MVPLVSAFTAVFFGELDSSAFDFINRADVNAIGANDFHMFFDVHSNALR
jgi:hypothetical protein